MRDASIGFIIILGIIAAIIASIFSENANYMASIIPLREFFMTLLPFLGVAALLKYLCFEGKFLDK